MIELAQLLLVCVVTLLCVLLARLVWEPLLKLEVDKVDRLQFGVSDILVLVAYLAFAGATTRFSIWLHPFRHSHNAHWWFLAFACIFAISMWRYATHRLAAAGINGFSQRAILLLVALPVTVASLGVLAHFVVKFTSSDGDNFLWLYLVGVPTGIALLAVRTLVRKTLGAADSKAPSDFNYFDD